MRRGIILGLFGLLGCSPSASIEFAPPPPKIYLGMDEVECRKVLGKPLFTGRDSPQSVYAVFSPQFNVQMEGAVDAAKYKDWSEETQSITGTALGAVSMTAPGTGPATKAGSMAVGVAARAAQPGAVYDPRVGVLKIQFSKGKVISIVQAPLNSLPGR